MPRIHRVPSLARRSPCLRVYAACCVSALLVATAPALAERRGGALPGGFHAAPGTSPPLLPSRMPKAAEASAPTFLDPGNAESRLLQHPDEAFADLPKDRRGNPDWAAALASGVIAPRADLSGTGTPYILDLDILMTRTRGMPAVRFPHRAHTQWLTCANCHPAPFVARAGANRLGMTAIFRGQGCGLCHGKVAFAPQRDCDRCHAGRPREGA